MKVSESVCVGSDAVANAFFAGDTLVLYTAHDGKTTVRISGNEGFMAGNQVTFDTRNAAIKFVKDAAHGLPMQYNKQTNTYTRRELTRVRLCFMDGWATMNTNGEGF
jgi:hypothetical protein